MVGRHKNNPKRELRGAGIPTPGKDRTTHMASRGKKLPTLSDLSRNDIRDEHVNDIMHELDNQSDRGAALIAAAVVEVALRRAISSKIGAFPDWEEILFESEGAPMGTFYARIKMARALCIIGPIAEAHLDAIRRIRNQFAHSVFRIDFESPAIAQEIDKLLSDDSQDWKPEFSSQRRRYTGTAVLLAQALENELRKQLEREPEFPVWLS